MADTPCPQHPFALISEGQTCPVCNPVCQECGTPLGQRHPWGCDSVIHGDVALVNGQPPLVTLDDCKED
jgi:hypothetical protein